MDLLTSLASCSGVLIECDPSIKSIIVNIDSVNHDFIIEDLDEERVVVKENMVHLLKQKLEDVCWAGAVVFLTCFILVDLLLT